MSERSEAIVKLHRLAAREPVPEAELAGAELAHARLAGATVRPGDTVFDPVTGQEGTVVNSRFVHAPVVAP